MELVVKGLDKLKMDFINYGKFNNVAVSNALNKTGAVSTNVSLRVVKKQGWNMSMKELKKLVAPTKSKATTLNYIFTMKSKSISLMKFKGTTYFSETQLKSMKRKSKAGIGVRYKLKGKGRLKTLKKSFVRPSLFGTHAETVFTRRKSPMGADITAQYSITPSSMFQQEGEEVFIKTFKDKFTKTYFNQLKFKKII